MRSSTPFWVLVLSFLVVACSEEAPPAPSPAPAPAVKVIAAAPVDAGAAPDAGTSTADAGSDDGGSPDAGGQDLDGDDAGSADAGAADAGTPGQAPDASVLEDLGPGSIVTVLSIPAGATVSRDGVVIGLTPAKVAVRSGVKHLLRLELAGFYTEDREVQGELNHDSQLSVDLRPAARLVVVTEPPGATVQVRGAVVLEKTPGTTAAVDPGPAEVVVTLAGHQQVTRELVLSAPEERLELKLVAGVTVRVESSPRRSEVAVDGVVVGKTPLDVTVDPRAKQTLTVSRPGWSTFKKVLTRLKGGEKFNVKLVDVELAAAKKRLARAQEAHDRAYRALEKVQATFAAQEAPSDKLEAQVNAAEVAMERATQELEAADGALKALEARRLSEAERDAPKPGDAP
jgi:hypothetical protein